MTVGLLAKTALFPLHIWLPPAHAGAPAAASAVLSALVVKGSWFLVVRLWFDVMPGVVTLSAAQLLAGLGATAIVVGSVVALRQERLKLLVAYSTIAQIGYLFLMFPARIRRERQHTRAWLGLDRWTAAGSCTCHSQGRHVHGRRPRLCRARPRPDCRPRRHGARDARYRARVCGFRPGTDGRRAERCVSRKEAPARRRRQLGTVVVDHRAAGRRGVHGGVRGTGAHQCAAPSGGASQPGEAGLATVRVRGTGAGGCPRCCSHLPHSGRCRAP